MTVNRPLKNLDEIDALAQVCWDRDGVSDLLADIEPDETFNNGRPRIWTNNDHNTLDVCFGNESFPVARYVRDPVPHWNLYPGGLSIDVSPDEPLIKQSVGFHQYL